MAGFIEADATEVRRAEVDISRAPGRMQRNAHATTLKGARRVAREMRTDARGHRYLPKLPKAVSYDMLTALEAEIGLGPKKGTQGSLAHIIAYGSVNNAPVYDHTAGIRRATPAIERDYAEAGEASVFGGVKGKAS
jgi:hypothetical protein